MPNHVRRKVHERDGEQCAFVSADGVRCAERGFLELDHRVLVARGGKPTEADMRLLCDAHNQYEAERVLGADFTRAKREAAHAGRRARQQQKVAMKNAAPPPAVVPTPAVPPTPGGEGERAGPDADVEAALRTSGFKATETRRAMSESAGMPASTFEERVA